MAARPQDVTLSAKRPLFSKRQNRDLRYFDLDLDSEWRIGGGRGGGTRLPPPEDQENRDPESATRSGSPTLI